MSNATGDSPVDVALFRTNAGITEDQLEDRDFTQILNDSINILESKTDFSVYKGTYTCYWDQLPYTTKLDSDPAIIFPGFYATVNTVEYQDMQNNWNDLDHRLSERSEMGSIRIKPDNGRWPYSGIKQVRVVGTAGCDDTNKLPGLFHRSLVLIFRNFYYSESESMDSAERLLDRWIATGSLL